MVTPPARNQVARWFYTLGALLIVASWLWRPALPPSPLWDPDTWGYLHPALSWLDGGDFQQMHGRSGFYPSLLLLFLKWGGGLSAIPFFQHLLGLAAALLAWTAWWLWFGFLPPMRWRNGFTLLGGALGLLVLCLWMFNPHAWMLESEIRPEGVLPFFVFAQITCSLAFFHALRPAFAPASESNPGIRFWHILLTGTGALAFSGMALALKPSWILAATVMWLAVLPGLLPRRSRLPVAAALLLGAAFCLGGKFFYSQWLKPDNFSRTFLPMTLLTIHAPWVLESWEEELASDSKKSWPVPREVLEAFVENFRTELDKAKSDAGWYTRLGFDPDYLMYRSSVNKPLGDADIGLEDAVALHKSGYFLAWQRRTGPMAQKVLHQFDYFLRPDSRIFAANRADWPRFRDRTGIELDKFPPQPDLPVSCAILRDNRSQFDATTFPASIPRPAWIGTIASIFASTTPWLLGAFALWWILIPWRHPEWFFPGAVATFLLALPAANAFAVSLTHALDMTRYCFTFAPFYALALAAIALLIFCWAIIRLFHQPAPPSENLAATQTDGNP